MLGKEVKKQKSIKSAFCTPSALQSRCFSRLPLVSISVSLAPIHLLEEVPLWSLRLFKQKIRTEKQFTIDDRQVQRERKSRGMSTKKKPQNGHGSENESKKSHR